MNIFNNVFQTVERGLGAIAALFCILIVVGGFMTAPNMSSAGLSADVKLVSPLSDPIMARAYTQLKNAGMMDKKRVRGTVHTFNSEKVMLTEMDKRALNARYQQLKQQTAVQPGFNSSDRGVDPIYSSSSGDWGNGTGY